MACVRVVETMSIGGSTKAVYIVKEYSPFNSYENHESVEASTLRELREVTCYSDGPWQFRELVNTFLDGLKTDLASTHKALAEENRVALTEFVHGIKGAAASMGASYLASLCSALEQASANAKLEEVENRLKQIESEMKSVRGVLEKETSDERV
jgi:HPt (histidine-containing phosphotransfer) domain-containing protein